MLMTGVLLLYKTSILAVFLWTGVAPRLRKRRQKPMLIQPELLRGVLSVFLLDASGW